MTALSLGGLGGPSGAGGLGLGLATTPSRSQTVDFSGRIVELIIPFREGGGSDTWGRFNAPFLSRYLPGQPTVAVRNVPGGNRVNGGGDGGTDRGEAPDGSGCWSLRWVCWAFCRGRSCFFLTFLRRKAQQTLGIDACADGTSAMTQRGISMHTSDGKAPSIWKKMT